MSIRLNFIVSEKEGFIYFSKVVNLEYEKFSQKAMKDDCMIMMMVKRTSWKIVEKYA